MNGDNPQQDPRRPAIYEIRVRGCLDRQWTDRFDGLAITWEDGVDTLLTGPVADQAALHGLLRKLRDLGITLIAINKKEEEAE